MPCFIAYCGNLVYISVITCGLEFGSSSSRELGMSLTLSYASLTSVDLCI